MKLTTYILGAKCNDGIVLIGDRKVSGTESFTDKIRRLERFPQTQIYFAAAGIQSLFEQFLQEIPNRVGLTFNKLNFVVNAGIPEGYRYNYSSYNFKQDCVNLLKEMKNTYSDIIDESALEVLFVVPIEGRSEPFGLFYMNINECYPHPIESIIPQFRKPIGWGHVGNEFLKVWTPEWSAAETAKLGYFIIRYIEKNIPEANGNVGVGNGHPQVVFFYNTGEIKTLNDEQMRELFSGIDRKIEENKFIF